MSRFSYCYAECHYAECHNAGCRGAIHYNGPLRHAFSAVKMRELAATFCPHNTQQNDIKHKHLFVALIKIVVNAECCDDECCCAEWHYTECHNPECCYAEGRGAPPI